MIRLQVQLTDEQARRLKEIARRDGVSVAEIVREAVDERFARERVDPWERASELVGRYSSGDTNVSVNHDAYLDAAYR